MNHDLVLPVRLHLHW